jgi:pimeloyl-ACP methyl ester carboxylesterase
MSFLESQPNTPTPRWKIALIILLAILSLWGLAIWGLVHEEAAMIFMAPQTFGNSTPVVEGLAFEDVHILVDGTSFLDAWWIPAKEPTSKVLMYFHGNAEVLAQEHAEIELFRQTGYNLLLVDYRGYGRSSHLQTTGATTAADARAALKYIEQIKQVPASDIVLCGWSVGTGVAAQLALETPDAAGLILISPITSVDDVANEEWVFRYPLRPAQWLRHDSDMATKDKIASIHIPALIVTGSVDTLAQPYMAQELYARAGGPKTLHFIDGADHNSIMSNENGELLRTIQTFLQSLSKTPTGH